MAEVFSPEQLNELYGRALSQDADGIEKLADATGLYVQAKLRENSFARRILPPIQVTESDLQRRVEDESLELIDDLEPDSVAMRINFRAEPDKLYLQSERYSIRLFEISSKEFNKNITELRSYRMPLTKVIEQNTVKDIQEQEDLTFMSHVNAGLFLATVQRHDLLVARGILSEAAGLATRADFLRYLFTRAKGSGAWSALATSSINRANGGFSNIVLSSETEFTRTVLKEAAKIQSARQLKAKTFLLHDTTWQDTIAWSLAEAGLQITSEIVVEGYKHTTIGGMTFVTTIRDNDKIVQPGQIYTFPSPGALGKILTLGQLEFFIDKRFRTITMAAYEVFGMGLGNILGLGLVLLDGARVTLPVNFTSDSPATAGNWVLINDYTQSSLPSITAPGY